jgi:hypothetical protein
MAQLAIKETFERTLCTLQMSLAWWKTAHSARLGVKLLYFDFKYGTVASVAIQDGLSLSGIGKNRPFASSGLRVQRGEGKGESENRKVGEVKPCRATGVIEEGPRIVRV